MSVATRFRKGLLSVTGKIITLSVGIALLTALLMGGLYYTLMRTLTLEKEVDKLSAATDLMALEFDMAFAELKTDVLRLSKFPPIQGIIRASQHDGVDPLDNSTTALWRQRLETIFQSMLEPKRHYVQIRFIGVADGGRELVRVNRTAHGLETISVANLQRKGQEAYFKIGLTLTPGRGYLSAVNLNREHGKISVPYLPVIRAIQPVFDEQNQQLFGMIVINAAYDQFLEAALIQRSADKNLFVINESGHYVISSGGKEITDYHLPGITQVSSDNEAIVAAIRKQTLTEGTLDQSVNDQSWVIRYTKLFFDPVDPSRLLILAQAVPQDVILQGAYRARQYSVVLAAGLVALTLLIAFISARFLVRPLNQMISEVRAYDHGSKQLSLPTGLKDEIGEMARVFEDLVKNLDEAQTRTGRYLSELERSNRELDDFAYIASHDLKEPLRGLAHNALFLKEDYAAILDEGGKKRLDRLEFLCGRMETLVNDLLYFSRLGRQELAVKRVDLNAVIKDIAAMMETTLEQEKVSIHVPKPLPAVVCDKPQIAEVLRNLITNAVKYNDRDDKIVEVGCIDATQFELPEQFKWVFYVKDNGIGIDEKFFDDIFRIFKRLNTEDDTKKGTGVGLTFVKKIIERHSGKIWLESEEGVGTTFYFTLSEAME